jgi:hypothetical protein
MDNTISTNIQQTWSIIKVRKVILSIVSLSALGLLIRAFLLAPEPPTRPYLLKDTSHESLLQSLQWYSKYSMGSLKANENRCIVKRNDYSILCPELNLENTNDTSIKNIINNGGLVPYTWKTKEYDKDIILEFALFNLQPLKIISTRERSTVFGTELIVMAEFEKTSISKVSEILISLSKLNGLKTQIGKKIQLEISYQPNPYGYYLPIYPRPILD